MQKKNPKKPKIFKSIQRIKRIHELDQKANFSLPSDDNYNDDNNKNVMEIQTCFKILYKFESFLYISERWM